jgi:hypothetical protein
VALPAPSPGDRSPNFTNADNANLHDFTLALDCFRNSIPPAVYESTAGDMPASFVRPPRTRKLIGNGEIFSISLA